MCVKYEFDSNMRGCVIMFKFMSKSKEDDIEYRLAYINGIRQGQKEIIEAIENGFFESLDELKESLKKNLYK